MRLLGTLPNETHARRLADYLLTLGIGTRVNQEGTAWEVWVRDDDHVPRARQEWEPFRQNPDDPRFQSAQQIAAALKKKEEAEEARFRHNQRKASDLWARPTLRRAPLTLGLLLLCVLVALFSQFGDARSPITRTFSFAKYAPSERFHDRVEVYGLRGIQQGELWRLWTPIFLHFSVWHLLLNMLAFLSLGLMIESRRGPLWMLGFILLVGLVSNVAQYAFPDWFDLQAYLAPGDNRANVFSIFGGMSGVLFGLFGYLWMKVQFDPEPGLFLDRQSVFFLLSWLVLCMTGALGNIGNTAHVAGLLAGMAWGLARWAWQRYRPR